MCDFYLDKATERNFKSFSGRKFSLFVKYQTDLPFARLTRLITCRFYEPMLAHLTRQFLLH